MQARQKPGPGTAVLGGIKKYLTHLEPAPPHTGGVFRKIVLRAAHWGGLYLFLVLVPLAVVLLGDVPAGRGFWTELGVTLGILGFAMLGVQFLTTSRFRRLAPFFGSDTMIQFHRQTGILAFVFILAHPVILFVSEPRFLEFLDPRVNSLRTVSLVAAVLALAGVVLLPFVRERIGMSYEWWRLTHGLLAAFVMLVGLAHALRVGHYVNELGKQAFWVAAAAATLLLLVYVRVIRPWQAGRRPYRVVEVRPERGRVWTLRLEADGHKGLCFRPGQFAWITLGDSPFVLQQHPFSISSSAVDRGRLELTIKELGDFTASVKDVAPGARAFVDGPYGAFTLHPQAPGAVFIMGGIGITPGMSILRTLRDQGDRRPLLLIYANKTWEDVAFREELEEMQQSLNLRVVHVLEQPDEGWRGESGFVTSDMLNRYLDAEEVRQHVFLVCGPPPMMDKVEPELLRRGVAPWRLLSERFNMV